MLESEASIQICAPASKTAIFAPKSQLSVKELLCPPVLSPMAWSRRATGMDQTHSLWEGCRKRSHRLKEKQGTCQAGAEPLSSTGFSSKHRPAPGQRQEAWPNVTAPRVGSPLLGDEDLPCATSPRAWPRSWILLAHLGCMVLQKGGQARWVFVDNPLLPG